MRHDPIHRAHPQTVLGGVGLAEEEDLAGELLPDLPGQVRRPEAAVERADVGIGLLEASVLCAGQGEVADHVQAVTTAGGPAVDERDHDLRHEPDQPLHLEDVQPPERGRIDACRVVAGGVLIAGSAADPLVPSAAERPAAVLG